MFVLQIYENIYNLQTKLRKFLVSYEYFDIRLFEVACMEVSSIVDVKIDLVHFCTVLSLSFLLPYYEYKLFS